MIVSSLQDKIEIKKREKKTDFVLYKSRKTVSKYIQKKKDHITLCNAVFCCLMHSVKT